MKCDNSYNKFIFQAAPAELRLWLESQGYTVIPVSPAPNVSTPIANHPDIQMCRLGCNDSSPLFRAKTTDLASLSGDYPGDVPFNAACTGRYFIHNTSYTDPKLMQEAVNAGMIIVDVRQGYTKCSCTIVDEGSIITYDAGICKACRNAGMDVLLIEPGHIRLDGYDTGFIGGTSGRVGDTIVFNGDISAHPDGERIMDFIKSRGLECKYFDYELSDIGSII